MNVPKPPTYTPEQADAYVRDRDEAAGRKQREALEAADRQAALKRWQAEGGDEASFAAEWPAIRTEQLRRRVLDRDDHARSAYTEHLRRRF